MKLPILIVESYDVSVYPTVEQAVVDLEVFDIMDGIYTAYDSEGHLLELKVATIEREVRFLCFRWFRRYSQGHITENEPAIDRSDELREKLIYYLVFSGFDESSLKGLSLAELIQHVGSFMPWSRKL